ALAAGRKAKDTALIKRVVEVGKTVTAAKQQWDGFHKAQATLAKTPDDTAANLAVGRYLALVQGDWEQGLAHLAKGPDGPLKDLAVKGLKPPAEPAALAEMGDAWFDAADKAKGKDKADLRAGAAYWYSLAEPGLTGLAKTIVEKRLKELGGKVAVAQSGSGGKLPETIELPLAPGVSMKFRLIPAGTFTMGAPGTKGQELDHQVNITRPFYFGITEVTQAQWLAVMGSNPSASPGDLERPVEGASWNDCQQFLERLNQTEAARKTRFRLPTEAEWEYACRAGTTTGFCFGDDLGVLPQFGWFKENSAGTTHPVGQLKPNAWGLFDMHGNVYEWCSDWWGPDYYKESPPDDPQGPPVGANHLVRGGSWSTLPFPCRSYARNYSAQDAAAATPFGLRVVWQPELRAGAASKRRASGGPSKSTPRSQPSGGKRPLAFNQADVERGVANWVLSLGGKVKVTLPATPGQNPVEITAAAQLPAEPFVLYGIELNDCNTVTDKDFARIEGLANLVEFKVRQVPIGDEGVAHLAHQRNLSWLILMNTNTTDAGLVAIGALAQLNSLVIAGNRKITDAGVAHLRGLTQLRSLWLNFTAITGAGLKHLHNLPMLLSLGLPDTKLGESDLKDLAGFKTVTFVSIDGTPGATDAGMAILRAMPALTGLHVAHSSVGDKGLEILATFPGLKTLDVKASRVTDAGVQRFRALRPDCEIVH
ncbi:MAG TPA: SUMF1/EgtB/PvdO family nonheme iron enzyme, partial [Pirellulales bacterium]|nr:SUMF1/EgtB/PvdO family nonheme iron enzyme [Pirellulales bacterium]